MAQAVHSWNKLDIGQISSQALDDPLLKLNLSSHDGDSVIPCATMSWSAMTNPKSPASTTKGFDRGASEKQFQFLALPLELRQKIYHHLLAHEVERGDNLWRRGNTAILATNHQVHDEALELLYGHNTFHVEIDFTGVFCRICYLTPRYLKPNYRFRFLEVLSPRTISYVKHYEITITPPDSYTGMIKYNFGLADVTQGVKSQVQTLVEAIRISGGLRVFVHVSMDTSEKDHSVSQVVLEPFLTLYHDNTADLSDDLVPRFASYVKEVMEGREEVPPFGSWLKSNLVERLTRP